MTEEKRKIGNLWMKLAAALLVLVLTGNSVMLWQMRSVVDRVDKYNQGVVDELGGMRGDVKNFADDLNEIRRFLLLPEKHYSVEGQAQSGDDSISPELENNMALFAMLDSVSKEKKAAENQKAGKAALEGLLRDQIFLNTLNAAKLSIGEKGDVFAKFNSAAPKSTDGSADPLFGQPFFNLAFDAEKNVFKMQSVLGEEVLPAYNDGFEGNVMGYMMKNSGAVADKKLAAIKQESDAKQKAGEVAGQEIQNRKMLLDNLIQDRAFQETLAGDGWHTDQSREDANKHIFDVKDAQGNVVFSLAVELSSGMIKVLKDGQEIDIKSYLDNGGSKKKL